MISSGARGPGLEGRQLLEDLRFLRRRQIPTSDFVHIARTAGVHHDRALAGERVFDGQMDLVGTTGDLADGPDGRVHHDDVAGSDAERAKISSESLPGMHGRRYFNPNL